jgi:hypothetical protein
VRRGLDLAGVLPHMRRWAGVGRAAWVVEQAEATVESPLETLGRFVFIESGFPMPITNAWVGRDGPEWRLDGLLPWHWWGYEGDGALKYDNREDASKIVGNSKNGSSSCAGSGSTSFVTAGRTYIRAGNPWSPRCEPCSATVHFGLRRSSGGRTYPGEARLIRSPRTGPYPARPGWCCRPGGCTTWTGLALPATTASRPARPDGARTEAACHRVGLDLRGNKCDHSLGRAPYKH